MSVENLSEYTFDTPIEQAGQSIKKVRLRRPVTGDLRGLKLFEIMQSDINTMIRLLPRITEPALAPDTILALPVADMTGLSGRVISFFISPRQQDGLLLDLETEES